MIVVAMVLLVPQVVGMELPAAVESVQRAGIEQVQTVDASGLGRFVVTRRDWLVCSQNPADGDPYTGGPVTLGVVKRASRVRDRAPIVAPCRLNG